MREVITISAGDILPDPVAVMRAQGLPAGAEPEARIVGLVAEALARLADLSEVVGLFEDISSDDFGVVYEGEGLNEYATPVADIYPRAERLALFAVTLGRCVSAAIDRLFAEREFALASLLDSAASEGAEKAADVLQDRAGRLMDRGGGVRPEGKLLRYSPGYCGWHVSGQKSLFAALRPAQIGVTLTESCLMEPLKSISGVLVRGPAEIHTFEPRYACCHDCAERSCLARMRGSDSVNGRER